MGRFKVSLLEANGSELEDRTEIDLNASNVDINDPVAAGLNVGSTTTLLALSEIKNDVVTHIADKNNPHETTFTQAVDQDPNTDITAAEAEQLTNNSVSQLHRHHELWSLDGISLGVRVATGGNVVIGSNNEITLDPGSNQRVTMRDVDSDNAASVILNDSELIIDMDIDQLTGSGQLLIRGSGSDIARFFQNGIRFHDYPNTRNDGETNGAKVFYPDANGVLKLGELRQRQYHQLSGRFEVDLDADWASWSDPNFGPALQDWDFDLADSGPGGIPEVDWDGIGLAFPKGAILRKMFVKYRGNNTDIDELQLHARMHDQDLLSGDAIDSIGEIGVVELNLITINTDPPTGPANGNDLAGFEMSLGDYEVQNEGADLHVAMKATAGTLTGNRNVRCTITILWDLPLLGA